MDGDERRRRSLEAGGEMLEKYKAEQARKLLCAADVGQGGDISDAESLINDRSMDRRESCAQEGMSSRDMTQSSISMSEGEGEGDLEIMASRVAKLQEVVQGKVVLVEALSAEIDQFKGEPSSPHSSQSQTSSSQGMDVMTLYHKLQEFEEEIESRNHLIERLSQSLKTALDDRDHLQERLKTLNSTQLPSLYEGTTNLKDENVKLHEKVAALEAVLSDRETMIRQLNAQLDSRDVEINDRKLEIDSLRQEIQSAAEKDIRIAETLEQQKQYELRVEKIKREMQEMKKISDEMEANNRLRKKELKDKSEKYELEIVSIRDRYEEKLKSLQEENKALNDHINKELPKLEMKHAKELAAFQSQLSTYKTTIESLKIELINRTESQKTAQAEVNMYKTKYEELKIQTERARRVQELNFKKEKEMLLGQIDLHKTQLNDITSKHLSTKAILESKESLERTLEEALINAKTLRQDNELLKFKLDDLSSRYSGAQSLIESSQQQERSLSNRVFDLEKSLSRVSAGNISTLSELNETTYQTFNDMAIQYEIARQTVEEKSRMERMLSEKVQRLEEDVKKATEELEEANLAKESYEKQLKDMKNMCDKLTSEVNTLSKKTPLDAVHSEEAKREEDRRNSYEDLLSRVTSYEEEIKNLKGLLDKRELENSRHVKELQDLIEKARKSDEECAHLKHGLARAYAECAEMQEKLNQSLAMNDSKINVSQSFVGLDDSSFAQLKVHDISNARSNPVRDQRAGGDSSNLLDNTEYTAEVSLLMKENENLKKDLNRLLENQRNNEETTKKLQHYQELCDKLEMEKLEIMEENMTLKKKQEVINSLRQCVNQLKKERESLQQEMRNLIEGHKKEVDTIRNDSAMKIEKVQSLLDANDGNKILEEQKAQLEARHSKEMSELRRYFEQKCQQMEKQYFEETYSQQSKKISDNDSEIEELTDDLYIGGGNDCLEISNIAEKTFKDETPAETGEDSREGRQKNNDLDRRLSPSLEKDFETDELDIPLDFQDLTKHHAKEFNEKQGMTILLKAVNQHCQTEWNVDVLENSAYRHELEEQVAQAKRDLLDALQEKIQALLAGEDDWPSELLQLRDKFTGNAKRDMDELKAMHACEIQRLKEEHCRTLATTVEHWHREMEKIKAETKSTDDVNKENEMLKEKNNLNRTCAVLKNLVHELIKHFALCEEELNNTLISEVLRRQLSCNFGNTNLDTENDPATINEKGNKDLADSLVNTFESKVKRVHFAPQIDEIVSVISKDKDISEINVEDNEDIGEKLKRELNSCLRRLKVESAQILGKWSSEGQEGAFDQEADWRNSLEENLHLKLSHAESLILSYQEESERLNDQITELRRKLENAESKKEIVSEGYGEHDECGGGDVVLQDFSQLQEKARHVLSNGGGDCSYLLEIIDEFYRRDERLMDETRKEKEDLRQEVPLEPTPPQNTHRVCCRKIEAADKQLKATRKFLEEQASEREAERDESARQIQRLEEQLKEREREKERDIRRSFEQATLLPEPSSDTPALRPTEIGAAVDALELQMRELSAQMADIESKKADTENELKAAIDKIWTLRDIITDFEQQMQVKAAKEEALQNEITQLKAVISAQTKNQQELVQELDAIKMGSESSKLNEHICDLQEELRKHKLSSEHFNANSSALKQMKVELREMLNVLDKRTKDLESLHMCGSNLSISQPSEDVSIRDQIDASRCPTPDDPGAPPMLPLDQVLKLKDKLSKHARAEEVVFKRIRDLEIQLTSLKNQNEDLQAEQEILQQTASEQLFQIEAMRGRLEQQKQNAPFAQRQATSKLELQLHEATAKFQSLQQVIADKDLELKDIKSQLERTNQMLLEKEAEIANVVQFESNTIQKLKERLQVLEEDKRVLESKLGHQEQAQLELPKLLDTMLADKNEEIDHLKEQLLKKEKQLNAYSSAALDEAQFREFAKQSEPKNSARTLSDILSIHSECEDVSEAIRALPTSSRIMAHNASTLRIPVPSTTNEFDTTTLLDANKGSIQVPPLDLDSHSPTLSTSGQRHSRISLGIEVISPPADSGHDVIDRSDDPKSNRSIPANEKERHASCPKHGNKSVDTSVGESVEEMTRLRIDELERQLNSIKADLRTTAATLDQRDAQLIDLRKNYEELQMEFKETVDTLTRDKHFYMNQYELSQASESKIKKDLEEVENALKLKAEELQDYKSKMQVNEKIIMELSNEKVRLGKNAEAKEEELVKKYEKLLQEMKNLKDTLFEREVTVETIQTRNIEIENENRQLYEFKAKYEHCKQELLACRSEIQRLTEGMNNRDQVIKRLEEMARRTSLSGASSPSDEKDQEIHHLQEYIKEKDKVIREMSDDSKSLHKALETIQNKMKESGNVVELRRKLKEQRKINIELKNTVDQLTSKLAESRERFAARSQDDTDIEDMVQRELNLSASLDRQILNAIESESEEDLVDRLNGHSRQDLRENVAPKYMEIKFKLKQTTKEKEELNKLKDDLEIERDMLKCQVAEYESRILQIKADLEEECKRRAKIDEELSFEKSVVRNLKIQLDKEQRNVASTNSRQAEIVEFLQDKLRSSMESEERLRNDISVLRLEHQSLEKQLCAIREEIQPQKPDESSQKITDLLVAEQNKYMSLLEEYENERASNVETKAMLKKVEAEKKRYEKQLDVIIEEKEKIVSSLALTEEIKEHLDIDLRRTREELKTREEECHWLQTRIETMTAAEAKRQKRISTEHDELKSLRWEVSNARDVIMDLEADMQQSRRELTEAIEREVKLNDTLEKYKEKEAELSKKLAIASEVEKVLRESIAELQQDLAASKKRVLELARELDKGRSPHDKATSPRLAQKMKELTESNERYVCEKNSLCEKLLKAREEKKQLTIRVKHLESQLAQRTTSLQNVNSMNEETVRKLQHFYGKYLRTDSRRKALAYQKRYLLCIVGGYQLSEENTLSVLARLTQTERSYTSNGHKRNPKVRFRSVVCVIVTIHRMKWLIERWRTGKRIGANTLLDDLNRSFVPIQRPVPNHSPPVKERIQSNGTYALGGPALEEYYQRLRNIQRNLGLSLGEPNAASIVSD